MTPLEFKKIKAELRAKFGKHITDTDVTSYVMYPKVFEEYQNFLEKYGDLSVVPTRYFLGKPDVGEEMAITCVIFCIIFLSQRKTTDILYYLVLKRARP